MPVDDNARVAMPDVVLTRRVGDELVLLHTVTEMYFGLDPVGTAMWEALLETGTIGGAHAALAPKYDADPERLFGDLRSLAHQLIAKGLLTVAEE